jgi:hypothetical protein
MQAARGRSASLWCWKKRSLLRQVVYLIVALASELIARLQALALTGHIASRWEPTCLRPRLFSAPRARAASGGSSFCTWPARNATAGRHIEAVTRLTAFQERCAAAHACRRTTAIPMTPAAPLK